MQGLRHLEFHIEVSYKSVVNLLQARWTFSSFRYTERQTHRLVLLDVGVLTNNDYLQFAETCFGKSVEYEILGRVAHTSTVLFGYVIE